MSNFRRSFKPTPEEKLHDYEQLLNICNKAKGHCSCCVHYRSSDMPGFVEDHGECVINKSLFASKVIGEQFPCDSYEENRKIFERLEHLIAELKGE